MMAEAIHLLGLPKKHKLAHIEDYSPYNPFDRRFLVDPMGTQGDWRIGGSGYVYSNVVWYLVLATGTGSGTNWIDKLLGISQNEFDTVFELEVGVNHRYPYASDGVIMIGTGTPLVNAHFRSYTPPSDHYYCAFWLEHVGTDKYEDRRVYARTQQGSSYQESDLGLQGYASRHIFRIEKTAKGANQGKIKYFIDGILVATHDAYAWGGSYPAPYAKVGIADQATLDGTIVYYFVRYISDR